ncbi:MAG: hypothetical protein LBQ79_10045, partial [Deltaproteobacteria bacterium]|nr:hypothetical protein [Deltaproteobacteria bacterium]
FRSRFKSVIIAWLAFDVMSFLLFAAVVDEITLVKMAAFASLFLAGTAAAAALVMTAPQFEGAPPPLVGATASVAALVYVPAAAVVALVFMTGAATGFAALLLVQLLLLAFFVTVSALMFWAVKRKRISDASTERRAAGVYGLLARAQGLLAHMQPGSGEAQSLERAIEEIRYFDKNSSVPADREIAEKLMALDEIYSPRPASPPSAARLAAPAPPEDALLESLNAAVSGEALPQGGGLPAGPPASASGGAPARTEPAAPFADPVAQRAYAAQLLEDICRLALRRKDESLNAKRGSL